MHKFPIGALLDSFRLDTKSAIKKAAEIGVQGLQMYSTTGENSPENLVGSKRRELLDFVKAHGLVFSAICGDLNMGFGNRELNPGLIEKSIPVRIFSVLSLLYLNETFSNLTEPCFTLSSFSAAL